MSRPMLEVIALDAGDARAAEHGGADRIELVSDMARWGLTPSAETVREVRAAVDLPVRVMVREADGFAAGEVQVLRERARELLCAGAEEFVLGFLTPDGAVDLPAVEAVLEVLDGRPWTFHKAIDFAADRSAAWAALSGLPGLDAVLSSGGREGVAEGLTTLLAEHRALAGRGVPGERGAVPRLIAGGTLREPEAAPLLAGGVNAFHVGTRARPQGSWDRPVDPAAVRVWAELLGGAS
ncbi:copper homeostasis protein CutC [Streptomyces sp. BE303]|uniref:copper homeostasis protein CutC n=1 Tax=Streptomyces sp. BE303 TaxID=3002528 RepID=UPI002E78B5D0|nr:copper homeostasis protein CutC [Streptomyces sp. BE303]MED7947739.1 copper homeostasis protein CutC [Streptomyces sp. BE303]